MTGEREAGQLYDIAKVIIRPLFQFFYRVEVEGLENVPTAGGAIIAPNHISVLDSFIVPAVLPRRITYVGKAEYMDDWKTKYLFPALGMIPIDRGGGEAAQAALDAAARVLDRGELFGIYPEGTRSRNGKLHKGHTGPARLALRCGVPIIPTGVQGTAEIQPADVPVPRPFRVARVRFGKPVDPAKYAGTAPEPMVLRQMVDEVMFEIRELTGQEYVNEYATKQSESIPTEKAKVPVGDSTSGNGARGNRGAPDAEGEGRSGTAVTVGAGRGSDQEAQRPSAQGRDVDPSSLPPSQRPRRAPGEALRGATART